MKRLLLPFLLMLSACQSTSSLHAPTVQSVAQVNLQRYAGTWYEIASYLMFFQRQCIGDTTAHYTLSEGGSVEVTNQCRTESSFSKVSGKATAVEGSGNAKLKVSFFWPFRSDYWVIGLDPDYRWAVVGHPNRKYLWVLSRTPQLPQPELEAALAAAKAQGYDPAMLRYTLQTGKIASGGATAAQPRSATIVITKNDGGRIGT